METANETSSKTGAERRRRLRTAIAGLAMVLGFLGASAPAAQAATGAVGGTLRCSWVPWGPKVSGLWTWTSTNGGRWDQYSNTQIASGYGRDLSNIPIGGQLLSYDLYCSGRLAQHGAFWINPGWNNRNITA